MMMYPVARGGIAQTNFKTSHSLMMAAMILSGLM
jgi:hypothetical protein